jgi:hypothetical protein
MARTLIFVVGAEARWALALFLLHQRKESAVLSIECTGGLNEQHSRHNRIPVSNGS